MEKTQLLDEFKKEVEKCRRCPLYKTRTKVVFGTGSAGAKLMVISEAPGYWEDQKGEPFVGAAGKVLDELLESVGIKREDVYICNILKCRPSNNRDPQPEEIEACVPYLEKQIEIIRPEVICSLGNFATDFIFKKYNLRDKLEGISKIHGKVFEPQVAAEDVQSSLFEQKRRGIKEVKIIPFYHPAVATYNPNMKEVLKEDFKVLKNL